MLKMRKQQGYILLGILIIFLFMAGSKLGTSSVIASRNENNLINLKEVPILNYHKVDVLNHALSISSQEFEEQMEYLYKNGYTAITPDQLMSYLKYGKELPTKPILITFDDGYLDNYTNAYPIMKKYGFTATIFIVTNLVGSDPRFMTWDQVREMQQNGIVFGSHTVNHQSLTGLSNEQIMNELTQSREEIARQLGKSPKYFAYPTGTYNPEIEEMVRSVGYKAAFTINYGQVGADSDLYALERIPIFKGQKTFRSFFIRLNGAPILEGLGIY
ncbi:polysaccharide deacetylase family protein [Pelosinus sp. sgz500959]|uniref:polysaccharide deacetylase family protein n=1 Tax=Pelosinus sp. sgz500959 TaxID=3242472 RepID=UPI00366A8FC3